MKNAKKQNAVSIFLCVGIVLYLSGGTEAEFKAVTSRAPFHLGYRPGTQMVAASWTYVH